MLSKICDKIILISFYLLFFLVPLILTPWNYELFEYNKMMVVYGLTIIILCAWLIKSFIDKKLVIRRTPFDLPLGLFFLSQVLSTVFSMDVHTSIWGYYSRFHGGLLSTVSYIILFYAFVSNIKDSQQIKNLLKVILSTALIVSLYGILEHFGIDKNLWVQDVQNRVFSSLGQPNWLAAYLSILIPISMAFAINSKYEAPNSKQIQNSNDKNPKRFDILNLKHLSLFRISNFDIRIFICLLFSVICYLTLLFTKSRSGIYAFWLSDIIFWGTSLYVILGSVATPESILVKPGLKDSGQARMTTKKSAITIFLITNFLFLFFTFIIGGSGLGPLEKFSLPNLSQRFLHTKTVVVTPPPSGQSALESGITESGDIRKIVWTGAWDIFTHNPILGTGVESFAFAYYKYRPAAHNLTSEWDFLYNKAHNEFLNFLATTGIFGFGSWMAFIIAYIWWSVKKLISPRHSGERSDSRIKDNGFWIHPENSSRGTSQNDVFLLLGLFTGWLSILVTDFFGFSVVIVALLFFLIPGISFVLSNEAQQKFLMFPLRISSWAIKIMIFIIVITIIFFEFSLFQMWRADTLFALGYKLNRSGQITKGYESLSEALSINSSEPYYHDEFSYTLATLAQAAYGQKEATLSALLAQQAIVQNDISTQSEPNNVNYFKTRTRVFYSLSQIDPKYTQDALDAILMASKLAPTDPKIHYNLAILYGRSGQTEMALKTLEETIKLKPDYRDPYYALALLEKDSGQPDAGKKNLEFILKNIDPNDQEAKQKLKEWQGNNQ